MGASLFAVERGPMSLAKPLAIAAACCLGLALAQTDAAARGSGGHHGFFGGGFHGFHSHDFHHFGHHDDHGHHFARHDFGRWNDHGSHDHFGDRRLGHWHMSSGFGEHDHSWHEDGVWHR
jgi:hypothetical protein